MVLGLRVLEVCKGNKDLNKGNMGSKGILGFWGLVGFHCDAKQRLRSRAYSGLLGLQWRMVVAM